MELKDKIVVITGSSSGIGRTTAIRFAKEGAKVVINYHINEEGGKEALKEVEKYSEGLLVKADVSKPDEVKKLFEEVEKKFGTVHILINNAAIPVEVKSVDGVTYVDAPLSIMPAWKYQQLESPRFVEELTKDKISHFEHAFIWAWENELKGLVRARTFAPDWGIPEDQANGSGSMKLAAQLNRSLIITHGMGSVIYARPTKSERAEVGGLVKIKEK